MGIWNVVEVTPADTDVLNQGAALVVRAFADHWPTAFPTHADALEQLHELCEGENFLHAAVADDGRVLGVVGCQPFYAAVWELQLIAVEPDEQGRGVGAALMPVAEAEAAARGALTLFLGTDDEDDMTSLSGVDLYPDVWAHIRDMQNHKRHPFTFYQRMGYAVVGVVPDANGPGKPDILMAKRVG